MSTSILGIGIYLPEKIRANDFWLPAVTELWLYEKHKINRGLDQLIKNIHSMSEAEKLILQSLAAIKEDLFEGSQKRHIMSENEDCVQMEVAAAKQALEHASIDSAEIDFVISQSTLPNYLCESNGYFVHKALNLPNGTVVYGTSGMCNAFCTQLMMAHSFIESGQHKQGLLLQSSGMSRYIDNNDRSSALYGDAATAVVIGKSDYGILSFASATYTNLAPLMSIGVKGKEWYDDGKLTAYENDPSVGFKTCLWSVAQSKILIEQALQKAKLNKNNIQFYATNQGTGWFRSVTQILAGLDQTKFYDTFQNYAGLIACNVPISLYFAYKNTLINKGDNIAIYTPGSGLQALSIIMSSAI